MRLALPIHASTNSAARTAAAINAIKRVKRRTLDIVLKGEVLWPDEESSPLLATKSVVAATADEGEKNRIMSHVLKSIQ
jgi:hypothetical protein